MTIIVDGVYHLVKEIGRGGMAAVYLADVDLSRFDYTTLFAYTQVQAPTHLERRKKAEELARELRGKPLDMATVRMILEAQKIPTPGAQVALKAATGQVEVPRFEGEWKNLLCLNHDNVVKVYGGGIYDGRPYYAMELLQHLILPKRIRSEFSIRQKLELVIQGGLGLQYLHDNGIIHRDIKPDNLVTCETAPGEYVTRVTDLGLGKALGDDSGLTMSNAMMGTPHYMSPEQIDSTKNVGFPADVYSLGAVLYEFMAGQRPYHDKTTLYEIISVVALKQPPVPVRELNPDVPEVIAAIAETAMAYDAKDRYASVKDLVGDILIYLDEEGQELTGSVSFQHGDQEKSKAKAGQARYLFEVLRREKKDRKVGAVRRAAGNARLQPGPGRPTEDVGAARRAATPAAGNARLQPGPGRPTGARLEPGAPRPEAGRSPALPGRRLLLAGVLSIFVVALVGVALLLHSRRPQPVPPVVVQQPSPGSAAQPPKLPKPPPGTAAQPPKLPKPPPVAAVPSPTAKGLPPYLEAVADAKYAPLDGLAPGSKEAQESQQKAVADLGLPLEVRTKKTGIVFRLVPAGTFTMGAPATEIGGSLGPQHEVTLTKAFYCGKFEVTQGQWERVMRTNPSRFRELGPNAPVDEVSWDDCQTFITKLAEAEGAAPDTFRLLSEAEWEYACRAGTKTALCTGEPTSVDGEWPDLDKVGWYVKNSGGKTHVVGEKLANAWGLYDLSGNVWEWCQDWHGAYQSGPVTDPGGPETSTFRVFRGGGCNSMARYCRAAFRCNLAPGYRSFYLSCRLALTLPAGADTPAVPPPPAGTGKYVLPPGVEPVPDAKYAPLEGLAAGSKEAQERQQKAVADTGLPLEVKTKKTGIVFRLVPAGTFTMGSPAKKELDRDAGEVQHQVTLTRAFYCGKFEVTQGQWQAVMGANPSAAKAVGPNAPVENVSWDDCQEFVKKLAGLEGTAPGTFRLLTEAEWEYACRAGTVTALYNGEVTTVEGDCPNLSQVGWYKRNSGGAPHVVGGKLANAWGLYDLHGNVWEWCADWYGDYPVGAATDPPGAPAGAARVLRGGCWNIAATGCRSAYRDRYDAARAFSRLGVRVAVALPVQ